MRAMDRRQTAFAGAAAGGLHALIARLTGLLLALALVLLPAVPGQAALPQGNAVTDPTALLRNALPIEQPDLQDLQHLSLIHI